MKKYISNLEEKVSSVLNESLVTDAAELVGIEEEDAEERIKGLSFANYIELGNAIDLEDAETAREILGTVSPIEEGILDKEVYPGDRVDTPMGNGTVVDMEKTELGNLLFRVQLDDYRDAQGDIVTFIKSQVKSIKEEYVKGKGPSNAKNYERSGGNKQQYKWKATLNNGKTKTVWGDSRANAKSQLGTNELIIGVKSLKKVNETSGAGGVGAGAVATGGDSGASVGVMATDGYGGIGTWDGKKRKKEKPGLKKAGKGIYEDGSGQLYHVTHTKYIPQIQKSGLRPLASPTNWVQQGSGERYGMGEIYVFTNREDAKKWAARMDWDFNQTIGSGEISIITLNQPEGQDFEKDEADPMSQAGQQGEWLKTYEPIEPENIVGVQVFKSMNESEKLDEIGAALAGVGRALGAAGKAAGKAVGSAAKAVGNAAKGATTKVATAAKTAAQTQVAGQEEQGAMTQYKNIDDLSVGDDIEVIDIDGDPTAVTVKTPRGPGDTLVVQTDKGEEHIVKKQAVSGTPIIQEMYEKALDEMRADDFSDVISQTPKYVAVFQATKVPAWAAQYVEQGDLLYWDDRSGTLVRVENGGAIALTATAVSFVGHFKYRDVLNGKIGDPVEEAYNANKTEHSGAKKGKGGYHGRKKDAKRDSNKKRRANDKAAVSEEASRKPRDPWLPDTPIPDKFYSKTTGKLIKSKAYYDWIESQKNVKEDKDRFVGSLTGMPDLSRYWVYINRDDVPYVMYHIPRSRAEGDEPRFLVVDKETGDWQTQYTKRNDEEPVKKGSGTGPHVVKESFDPATHVNVEHRDPEGRFIIVHAPPAGYWAVGKGSYQHDIDRTSFDNFDDALDHAHNCLESIDESINEIRRLAGLKEDRVRFTDHHYPGGVNPFKAKPTGVEIKNKHEWVQYAKDHGYTIEKEADTLGWAYKALDDRGKVVGWWYKIIGDRIGHFKESVNETASAGATGAGAIASAPTAMGGMVKRNPSIYGKPEPKKRKKESSDDGIGRAKKK